MYQFNEALQASKDYFNGDELAANVFLNKYALKDNNDNLLEKTPIDMHQRISKEFSRIEKNKFKNPLSEEQIFELLDHFKYIIPQGSPMYGIGNDFQVISLSNCYLLSVPDDSYASILMVDEQLVNISKRRGGVGIDLSNLRPKGTPTKNAARKSTGITSWMERYSNSIREVGQDGRRGALMLTLDIHHPDIIDFCTIKNDNTKVTGANISTRLSEEFIKALENNENYELRFPIDYKEKNIKPIVSKYIKAKEIWDIIIKSAHNRAEPGILAWYNTVKNTPADYYEEYKSRGTNPCLPSWTNLITKDGIKQLKDININEEIWSESGWTTVTNKWVTGTKKIYKYETTVGTFYGTENHKILSNKQKIEVINAKSIDILNGPSIKIDNLEIQDIMDGLVLGDGTIHKASNNLMLLIIGQDDQDYFNSEIKSLIGRDRDAALNNSYEITTTIQINELDYTYNRVVPNRFLYGKPTKIAGFLRGLYTANGSLCGERITFKTSSKILREQIQLMLSSLGIKSYFTTNKPTQVKFDNGTYLCKESYDVNITTDRDKFTQIIGFIQKYKTEKLNNLLKLNKSNRNKISYEIKKIEFVSEEEVFDITVNNNTHTFWNNGLNISNCSEVNLSPLDSCRLLCLNLYSYVVNPFTKSAYFDYNKFYNHSKIAQRLMDDLIDLESEKINKIIEKVENDPEPIEVKHREIEMWRKIKKYNDEGRRTGTGITALGDALAALGIKYGSKHSIGVTERIYQTLKFGCYKSSIEMAKELGAFKAFDYNKEKECPYIYQIHNEVLRLEEFHKDANASLEDCSLINGHDLLMEMKEFGRRNICLTTTAPTGSVSILTQTTSGIEPLFMIGYTRRKKINPNDQDTKVDFIDQNGDKWQEFQVYHEKIKDWMKITGETDITKSPWYGCCAEEIDWINRVKLQAAGQKHTCHSISSTINLPEDVPEEIVGRIYLEAFKNGCKGMTVYRKNCRSGVLIETKKQQEPQNDAPKRPQVLQCDIFTPKIKDDQYFVLIGLFDNKPYEVFAGHLKFPLQNNNNGYLKKLARGKYELLEPNGNTLCDDITKYLNNNEQIFTRLVSTALRHNTPLQFLIHQIDKTEGHLHSTSKVVARILKKYLKDGVKISGESCSECGKDMLERNAGCVICKNCGWSKCN